MREALIDLSACGLASMMEWTARSGLRLTRAVLRATMEIGAYPFSLTDRPRAGHLGELSEQIPTNGRVLREEGYGVMTDGNIDRCATR